MAYGMNSYQDPMARFNAQMGRPQTFREQLFGEPSKAFAMPRYTGQQTGLMSMLSGLGGQGMQQLYPQMMRDPYAGFQDIASEQERQYQQQTVPTIAERFTAMGGQNSSAFPQIMGQAGAGLHSQLGAMKQEYGRQGMGMQNNFLSALLGQGLQQQYEPVMRQGGQGAMGDIMKIIAQVAPYLIMAAI